jgi:hypothetical protein
MITHTIDPPSCYHRLRAVLVSGNTLSYIHTHTHTHTHRHTNMYIALNYMTYIMIFYRDRYYRATPGYPPSRHYRLRAVLVPGSTPS